jgi:4-hydroxy-tetrahydrodipicolinate reductase
MAIPLIMHGATGRMGRAILGLALADSAFTVVGGTAVDGDGTLRRLGLASDAPLGSTLPVAPGALVLDFSAAEAFPLVAGHCRRHRMALLSGTSGITPEVIERELALASGTIAVMWAANMSVGVNIAIATAARLARSLGPDYDIEIVESHHHHKVDAPSGTALALADAILAATGRTRADLVHGREGKVGERRRGEIGMHALRLGDIAGDHTVYFVGGGERILLSHVAHSREIFARGALRAASLLAGRPPGRYDMAGLLGL